MKCIELCRTEDLHSLSDDQLLVIWDRYLAEEVEQDDEWLRAFLHECWSVRSVSLPIDFRKGQLEFAVSEEDRRLINQDSLDPWVRPDCSRDDFSYVLCYGQSFAGYEFAEHAGFDLGEFANKHADEYWKAGDWTGDFVTLRCCLFYELRRQRHCGLYEDGWRAIQSLFRAVCRAYEAEVLSSY